MASDYKKKLGLALSGSGNRTTFYVGFLEVLVEKQVPVSYISACSGGSLAAAAFACGTLQEFKRVALALNEDTLKSYFQPSRDGSGLYSLEFLEEEIRRFTKNLTFEEVRPLMGFVAVDIESGEQVLLCMGDIARAAVISCALPGVFEPVKWGGKTLVDGGLLTIVPDKFLKDTGVDVRVGINMRGTKHIFTEKQLYAKKVYNHIKKFLLIDHIESLYDSWVHLSPKDFAKKPGLLKVISKSMDLAIAANKSDNGDKSFCDLTIVPKTPKLPRGKLSPETLEYYYQQGRQCALDNLPHIQKLLS